MVLQPLACYNVGDCFFCEPERGLGLIGRKEIKWEKDIKTDRAIDINMIITK